jgi:hypothetical protein
MFYVGLDLGQRQDFSALAVVEREEQKFDWMPAPRELSVRHLERMELGTPYPRVVERVCEVMRHPKVAHQSRLVVDATKRWQVPRGDLLAGIEVLPEAGELKICKRLKEAARLVREPEVMRVAGGGGEHDDLVFAVALAVWRARRAENSFGSERLPGI